MSRFRPNIVINGWEEPHLEDRARYINVGNAELGYAKLAIRCAVTMVDQHRGVKDGPEPLRTPPPTAARLMAAWRSASSSRSCTSANSPRRRDNRLLLGRVGALVCAAACVCGDG